MLLRSRYGKSLLHLYKNVNWNSIYLICNKKEEKRTNASTLGVTSADTTPRFALPTQHATVKCCAPWRGTLKKLPLHRCALKRKIIAAARETQVHPYTIFIPHVRTMSSEIPMVPARDARYAKNIHCLGRNLNNTHQLLHLVGLGLEPSATHLYTFALCHGTELGCAPSIAPCVGIETSEMNLQESMSLAGPELRTV